jgi:hypothetical protein
MGQIKRSIKAAGFPVSFVEVESEHGLLNVRFPVMGSQHGWRVLTFSAFVGHRKIADKVVRLMKQDWEADQFDMEYVDDQT